MLQTYRQKAINIFHSLLTLGDSSKEETILSLRVNGAWGLSSCAAALFVAGGPTTSESRMQVVEALAIPRLVAELISICTGLLPPPPTATTESGGTEDTEMR